MSTPKLSDGVARGSDEWPLYWLRLVPTVILDALVVIGCYALALALRFDGQVPESSWRWFAVAAPIFALIYIIGNFNFHIYRTAWEYGGLRDVIQLALATTVVTGLLFMVNLALPERHIPLSVNLIAGTFIFLTSGLIKMWPNIRQVGVIWGRPFRRMLIVGAGNTGQLLAREFLQHSEWHYRPIGFVDAEPGRVGMRIHGIPVMGRYEDIPALVARHNIDMVALAIPSASGKTIRELVTLCQSVDVPVRIVPSLQEMIGGRASPSQLREITPEDLLGREQVEIDYSRCSQYLRDKVILVTGAAGSIGSELAQQLLSFQPAALHILDNNETGLHDLRLRLLPNVGECEVRAWVADITNRDRLHRIFQACRPQLVFHAAAYKHVTLMEEHPEEAFRVNVLGTLNVCQLAEALGAEKMILISTDKAVDAVGTMGATKRICEMLITTLGRQSATVFCAVRFGNVMGSRGSVVPIFLQQIEQGGPILVTHPEATRYFLTIPEAVSLVIQAAAFASQGQIYLLDMGDEIKIVDLAQKMIRLRGLDPGREVDIVYTGLRPGEKLHEELVGKDERLLPTDHPRVLQVESEIRCTAKQIISAIASLESAIKRGAAPADITARIHSIARLGVSAKAAGVSLQASDLESDS